MTDMREACAKHIVFHYKGLLDDDTIFYETTQGKPFEIDCGRHMIMPQLERELINMDPGEVRTIEVGEAYGPYNHDAVQRGILKQSVPHGDRLCAGMEIMWTSPNNPYKPLPARIIRADDYSFDIDFNHPLAGKSITYQVEVIARSM